MSGPARGPVRVAAAMLAAGLIASVGSGCAAPGGGTGSPAGHSDDVRTVTVLAAASLREAFGVIAKRYEAEHPGVRVALDLGPSSGLAAQIRAGAPADVFASASTGTMDAVVATGAVGPVRVFAHNAAAVAVPAANPARLRTLPDLVRPGVRLAVCAREVPCGTAAADLFARAALHVSPVTEERDVTAVLTKIRLGEVDAGVVYATDVRAAGSEVSALPIPAADTVTTAYAVAPLTHAPHPADAAAFVEAVLGPDGQRALADAGFGRP